MSQEITNENEKKPIRVRILRRREGFPTLTRRGILTFIAVTYASDELAPEVLRFDKRYWSKEKEIDEITKRVQSRLRQKDILIVLQEE